MSDIHPYKISIPQSQIDDLNQRLSVANFPDELDASEWDLGAPPADIKRLATYWKDTFSWRKTEETLNTSFPHFTTPITVDGFDPLNIHFIHAKSPIQNAIPLLYVHGWPGSFLEGSKIINSLSGDGVENPAFHVVVISLPNFGFSEGPRKRGFASEQYAETCHKLMLKLGYDQYVTQGGDWGYFVTRTMSYLYPGHCRATHVNIHTVAEPPEGEKDEYSEEEKKGLERSQWFAKEGMGYYGQQRSKPQTLGYALRDSPVALLAWIYEKLHDWTDAYPWTEEEVCAWLSVYWFSTAGPHASVRIYYEITRAWTDSNNFSRGKVNEYIDVVKIGYSHQPKEIHVAPVSWVKALGDVVFIRKNPDGGHFFAWERPEYLIRDVRDMFRKGGGAYGVVQTGYI